MFAIGMNTHFIELTEPNDILVKCIPMLIIAWRKIEPRTHKHNRAHHTCGFCFYVCVLYKTHTYAPTHTLAQRNKSGVYGARKELKRYNIQMRAESVNASAPFHGLFFTLRVCMVFKNLFLCVLLFYLL